MHKFLMSLFFEKPLFYGTRFLISKFCNMRAVAIEVSGRDESQIHVFGFQDSLFDNDSASCPLEGH